MFHPIYCTQLISIMIEDSHFDTAQHLLISQHPGNTPTVTPMEEQDTLLSSHTTVAG